MIKTPLSGITQRKRGCLSWLWESGSCKDFLLITVNANKEFCLDIVDFDFLNRNLDPELNVTNWTECN